MQKTLILLVALILAANCEIDQCLKGKLQGVIGSICEGYPGGWDQYINNIGGNGDVKSGLIEKTQLDSIGAIYGLPPQVAKKIGVMKWAEDLVLESFSIQITVNQANVQEFIGAAYANGPNVVFGTISGNAWGNIVQKYDSVRKCKKKWYGKKKCWTEHIPRGVTEQELAVILQTLRAKSFEEVQAAFSRNEDSNLFADVDPLNMLQEGIKRELKMIKQEVQIEIQ